MFGGFLSFLSFIQKLKTKKPVQIKKRAEALKKKDSLSKRLSILQSQKELDADANIQNNKRKVLTEKSKLLMLRILTAIVSFFETIFIWIIATIGITALFIILAAVIIIIIVMGLITALDNDKLNPDMTNIPDGMYSNVRTTLQWTEEEINLYGNFFNNYEKNLYKIAVLTRSTIDGYGTSDKLNIVLGKDVSYSLFRMSLGVQTTETNYSMYASREEANTKDVFLHPSTLYTTGGIQGPYQMGTAWTLANSRLSDEVKNIIKSKYPNPNNYSERHFYPYATAISVAGTYTKMIEQGLNSSKYTDLFKSLAPQFGITADYDKFLSEAIVMLMQTAYLSAPNDAEREGICAFICGMWALSSDDPTKRSFDNYSLDFSGGLDLTTNNHQQFFGVSSSGGFKVTVPKEKGDLRNLTFGSKKTIKLNGEYLSKPLVAEVVSKYWDIPAIQKYNTDVLSYSASSVSTQSQFVLKGVYGIESFLVGKQILEYLTSKIPSAQLGGNTTLGDNHTITEKIGENTLLNMLTLAMKPVGRTMYSWGGGRLATGHAPIGFQEQWEIFYQAQKDRGIKYYFREFTTAAVRAGSGYSTGSPTTSTRANGLDCSGFVGWVVANNRNDGGYYSGGASTQGTSFRDKGLGKYTARGNIKDFKPGDVMTNSEHVYMVVGPSEKGGIVLVHASPNGVKLGGYGGGEATAKEYMEKYWPDVSNKSIDFNFGTFSNTSYAGNYDQFRWNIITSGDKGVKDPEGIVNMTAEQILKILFKE